MAEPQKGRVLRCAVYTRKSTEEGLEQAFNSLHAQREACEAYVLSQRHEGWLLVDTIYDDGGFSGGNLQRPALKQLLKDVQAGHVDVVVVYKVDRLTRSLADFAKIVEILDKADASFVSVTQAFNTTSSMGRLTLNVLLSFAQFEREVTSERIRDKIAASKAKGMWMGGSPPIGYDCGDGKLVVNAAEAEVVRTLFGLYVKLKSVDKVRAKAGTLGLVTKQRIRGGGPCGGQPFSRGTIYHLLENPLYVGDVAHQGKLYKGQHEAILDRPLFDKAQAILATQRRLRRTGEEMTAPSLLVGLLVDGEGRRFSPTHTQRRGRRYRYYAAPSKDGATPFRLPATKLEDAVLETLRAHLQSPAGQLDLIKGVQIDSLAVAQDRMAAWTRRLSSNAASYRRSALAELLTRVTYAEESLRIAVNHGALLGDARWQSSTRDLCTKVRLRRRGVDIKLVIGPAGSSPRAPDKVLVTLLAKGCGWMEALTLGEMGSLSEIADIEGVTPSYVAELIELAFLAPDLKRAILEGHQPIQLSGTKLKKLCPLPLGWADQRPRFEGV